MRHRRLYQSGLVHGLVHGLLACPLVCLLAGCASVSGPITREVDQPPRLETWTTPSAAGQTGRFLLSGERLSAPLQGRYEWVGSQIWLADPSGRLVGSFLRTPAERESIAGWTLADATGRPVSKSRAEAWANEVLGLSSDGLQALGLLLGDIQAGLQASPGQPALSRHAQGLSLRLVPD